MTEYANAPSSEVEAFAAGIETASGGTVTPGFGWGITSKLATQMQDYELAHRNGTGLDLDCYGADPQAVYLWAVSLECVQHAELLGDIVHVTVRPGSTVDLTGCPKPKKKKAAETVEDTPPE